MKDHVCSASAPPSVQEDTQPEAQHYVRVGSQSLHERGGAIGEDWDVYIPGDSTFSQTVSRSEEQGRRPCACDKNPH